jgi:hypothetical protein
MDEVWGEEDIVESEHLFRTLTIEGFRHGKQSEDEGSRQAGFNDGFRLGREVGGLCGNFLTILITLVPYQTYESAKDILLLLDPMSFEESFHQLSALLASFPKVVFVECHQLKSQIQKIFSVPSKVSLSMLNKRNEKALVD